MHCSIFFILVAHAAAFYLTATVERPLATLATLTATDVVQAKANVVATTTTTSLPSSVSFSSLVTIAPLSRNPLEVRQRCFNDQGFSVNCAAWTGYYYTWGGAGHPYAGGPGDGGNTGGSTRYTGDAIAGILGSANRFNVLKWSGLLACATVCFLVLL